VISNFDPRLREIIKVLGISQYVRFCILSHEEQMSKPCKEIFSKALLESTAAETSYELHNAEGILGTECLHIGDNYELDFLGATASGWRAALLVSSENVDMLPDLPKDSVFTSLKQFESHLLSNIE